MLRQMHACEGGNAAATQQSGGFPERRKHMTKTLVKALSLVGVTFLGVTAPGLLSAAECIPSAPNGWMAPFSMVTLKNFATNQFASYTGGILYGSSSSSGFLFHSETYSSDNNQQLFSDRMAQVDCPPPGQLGFCSNQPFDINKADKLGVSLTKSWSLLIGPGSATSYSGTVTLESWGNGKSTFPLTCDANTGILYGAIGSDTHVAVTIGTPFSPPK